MNAHFKSEWLLDPMDRAEEILFGLIMALSFTCSISIANSHHTEVRQLLVGAIGCNLAWGIVDAAMYLIGVLAQRRRNKTLLDAIKNAEETFEARRQIAASLPPVIALVIEKAALEQIRAKLIQLPNSSHTVRLTHNDFKKALALFTLVFVSTFPVVIPFVIIRNTMFALRISNGIAIAMLFLCGWTVARYVGFNKWRMSVAMVMIGSLLVAVTIALGG